MTGFFGKHSAKVDDKGRLVIPSGIKNVVPADQMDKFAHYLDCEAHTDIWKELYKTYNATNERDFVKPTTPRKRSDGQTAISNEI